MIKIPDIGNTTTWPESNEKGFYETLFHSYYADLCKLSFNIIKDKDKAEDVVQEVYVQLWQRRNSIEFTFSIKSYLFKSVYNKSITEYHKIIKRPTIDVHEHTEVLFAASNGEQQAQLNDVTNALHKAIGSMTDGCRTVFLMSREESLTYKEIAEVLGISIKTVENQMGKALKHLREHLKEFILLYLFFINL
ncbi:MAG: RNA polymerase sigma-70 factor [Cytophagaceae bacterium]